MKSLFLSTIFTLLCFCGFATTVTVNASSTGTTTSSTKTAGTITVNSSTNRGYAVFNLASAGIPAAATITSVKVIFTYTTSGSGNPTRTIYGYVGDISSLSASALYSGAITANTLYTASWGNTATTKTMTSTATADTFIQHNHTNTVSVTWVQTGGTTRAYSITGGTSPQLQIVYTCTTPTSVSISPSANPICSGSSETFTGNATGGATYAWSGPNGFSSTLRNPSAFTTSTASAGVYTFSATSTCNITTTATLTVTVKTVPSAMGGSTVVCQGGTTLLTNTGIGGTWSRSNSRASVTAGLVTGVTVGAVNITYSTGCGTAAVQVMSVRTTPAAITGTSNVCTGATVTLADATAGGTWSSSNTGVATINSSGVVTGVAVGSATITYNNQGCGIATKVINDLTSAGAISGATTLCTGLTTTLTNPTSGGVWSSSNTARATVNSSTGVVTGVAAGAVTITYNAGCGTNATMGMTMNASPNAISGSSSVCSGSATTLTCTPSGGTWSSSAPGTATVVAGVTTGLSVGTANISYTRSGCPSILAFSVKTTPSSISGSSNICSGTTTTLTNSIAGGTWSTSNSGVASVVAATGVVSGIANGTATITYSTGCGTAATRTETVISTPAAITGTTTVCSGSTTTLADATGGGSWSSSDNSLATVTSGGVVRGVAQGTVNITYAISSCIATTSVIVNTAPAAITGTSAFCGTGSATLANTSNNGYWTSADTTVALIDSASGLLVVFAPGSSVISYTNGCGSPATRTASYDYTPAAITGTTATCTGNSTTLSDAIGGGTWTSSNTSVASVNAATGIVYGITPGSATISYTLVNGCGTNRVTTGTTISQTGLWSGASSADWNDAGNWPCGTVPDASTDVIIPTGTTFLPSFAGANFDVRNLTINAGVTLSVGSDAAIRVYGNLTNNGIVNGDGDVEMVGSSAQTMYGKGTFSNLTVNNASGVSINSTDTVRIITDFTLAAGTFTTNNGLRLISNSTGTARIAPITGGSISGNVNIEQYFEGGRRAFRFFGHPFSSAISLNMVGANLDITGNGGNTNGFTWTASNAASCFRYDPAVGNASLGYDPGWRPFTSALTTSDTNGFKQYQGIRLFVRGAKGEGLGFTPYTPSPVTIKMAGPVNTGTRVITLVKGSNSDYNQVSNPYPSPTDIGTVIAAAHTAGSIAGSAFYVWNPFLGAAGAYESKIIGGAYMLDQNSSFQVRAATNGVTLTFNESNKATNGDETLLRATPSQYITLGVYDANNHGWDKMYVSFNENATNNEDSKYDATKAMNPDLNFYTYAGNTKFAVDARPYSNNTVIPVGFTANYAQQYTIKAENVALPQGATLYLHDKMLNQYTLLQAGAEYSFDITADKATQGENRFELTATTGAAATTGLNVTMTPNPATDNVTIQYTTDAKATTTVNVMNIAGASVMNKTIGNDASGKVSISLNELPAGIYLVEVTSGNNKTIQKLVKE